MNDLTLAFYGFTPAGRTFATVAPGNSTNTAAMRIKESMLTRFAGSGRLYYVRQRSKAHLPEACDSLVQQGFFAAHRKWRIAGSQLIVGAAVRSRADLAWLQALPPPAQDWTPAQAGR
jgi:hypothetical protein